MGKYLMSETQQEVRNVRMKMEVLAKNVMNFVMDQGALK
jgi:hypothetical protein